MVFIISGGTAICGLTLYEKASSMRWDNIEEEGSECGGWSLRCGVEVLEIAELCVVKIKARC
jgi:hypothetical protein